MGWGPDAGFIGGRQGRWRPARRPVTRLTVVGRGGGHVGGRFPAVNTGEREYEG